jgi:pimeloyl-ACP methyl ester carboxylesterase
VPDPTPTLVNANGLSFEVHTAGDPASDRLALLLHGFPEHAFSWRHQLPLFAQLGYRVWAPNQRGYGRSSKPKGVASYRIEHLVADVAGLIDAAGARHVTLVAHDWGGLVAWEFAARRVRPLDRLVIMNVPHPARFREELATNRVQRRRSLYAGFFQLPWLPEWFFRRRGAAAIEQAFRGMAIDKSRFPDDVLAVLRGHAARYAGPLLLAAKESGVRPERQVKPDQAPALEGVADAGSLATRRLSDIEAKPVRWLWPGRIARGKLTIIAGDPGLGVAQDPEPLPKPHDRRSDQ